MPIYLYIVCGGRFKRAIEQDLQSFYLRSSPQSDQSLLNNPPIGISLPLYANHTNNSLFTPNLTCNYTNVAMVHCRSNRSNALVWRRLLYLVCRLYNSASKQPGFGVSLWWQSSSNLEIACVNYGVVSFCFWQKRILKKKLLAVAFPRLGDVPPAVIHSFWPASVAR